MQANHQMITVPSSTGCFENKGKDCGGEVVMKCSLNFKFYESFYPQKFRYYGSFYPQKFRFCSNFERIKEIS